MDDKQPFIELEQLFAREKQTAAFYQARANELEARIVDLELILEARTETCVQYDERIRQLEAALEWYADSDNYRRAITQFASAIVVDDGERARKALGRTS